MTPPPTPGHQRWGHIGGGVIVEQRRVAPASGSVSSLFIRRKRKIPERIWMGPIPHFPTYLTGVRLTRGMKKILHQRLRRPPPSVRSSSGPPHRVPLSVRVHPGASAPPPAPGPIPIGYAFFFLLWSWPLGLFDLVGLPMQVHKGRSEPSSDPNPNCGGMFPR